MERLLLKKLPKLGGDSWKRMDEKGFEKRVLAFQRKVRRVLRELGVKTPRGKRDMFRPRKRRSLK